MEDQVLSCGIAQLAARWAHNPKVVGSSPAPASKVHATLRYMPYSGEQQRIYQRKWIVKRRKAWLDANGPCVKCGSWDDLEVDHIDPQTKRWPPAQIWGRKEADRIEELAKCQALCRQHHQEKSDQEKRQIRHGTATMYRNGCRCRPCKDHQAWRSRDYRMKYSD